MKTKKTKKYHETNLKISGYELSYLIEATELLKKKKGLKKYEKESLYIISYILENSLDKCIAKDKANGLIK